MLEGSGEVFYWKGSGEVFYWRGLEKFSTGGVSGGFLLEGSRGLLLEGVSQEDFSNVSFYKILCIRTIWPQNETKYTKMNSTST